MKNTNAITYKRKQNLIAAIIYIVVFGVAMAVTILTYKS